MKRFFLLSCILFSCTPAAVKNASLNPKPEWLSQKPNSGSYYIGIGHSAKDGTNNYLQTAKQSALDDLVSEIKVNVSSTSILNQMDINKEFYETYEQMIQTTAADEIEEYEQMGSWEDESNYWIYLRLSKQRYKEIKAEQQRKAVTLAMDYFTKAKAADRADDIVLALGFYFQGFYAIEKYLAEPITLVFEGNEILLTNEIYAGIQNLLDRVELVSEPKEFSINRRVAVSDHNFTVSARDKKNNQMIDGLPLMAQFEKGAGEVFPEYKTNTEGKSKILLTKISSRDLEQRVGVRVNLVAFAGTNPTEIYSLITQKLVIPKTAILLNVMRPVVYMSATEKTLGAEKQTYQLTNRIKNYLTNEGFDFTENRNGAELFIELYADSEKGAASGSIYITYVTATIRVTSMLDNRQIYATTLDRIKGYSLDYERSSQEAYNKSLEILEKEKMPELLNIVLQ
ncbi:MAG: hypothetical protein HC811_03900 [Flammeovirgaceae bacterium]|nr:hypothetical protein [Flammeovirgaceae bacterium]